MESPGRSIGRGGASGDPAAVGRPSDGKSTAWPLSFKLQDPQSVSGGWFGQQAPKRWWSHNLYRGPEKQNVEILYSKTKASSELIAKQFLKEPVLGFDMEWPVWGHKTDKLQCKIGLIQLACEDKIALFHIGLHPGKTTQEIIAPALREILESTSILKTGVGVLGADFSRLKRYFGLKPKAAFELSHLHRLVTYGARKPELVTTKLASLADQVEHHLGLPLNKGKARTSNWSKALNQQQITYAAADAYAGYMLYMCMDAKRVAMDPTPPLPVIAEKYGSHAWGKGSIRSLQLGPDKDGKIVSAEDFFAVPAEIEGEDNDNEEENEGHPKDGEVAETKEKAPKAKAGSDSLPLDAVSKKLFEQLSQQRKVLAAAAGVEPYVIAGNAVLQRLAVQRPTNTATLLKVKGVGKKKIEAYGSGWLEIISSFDVPVDTPIEAATHVVNLRQDIPGSSSSSEELLELAIPRRRTTTPINKTEGDSSSSSSPAFGSPLARTPRRRHFPSADSCQVDASPSQNTHVSPQRTPNLHTGLSFSLAETTLESQETNIIGDNLLDEDFSEESSSSPSQSSSALKRKRSPSSSAHRRRSPTTRPEGNIDSSETGPVRISANVQDSRPIFTKPQQLFRNKLEAFRKRVEANLKPKPQQPIVASQVLDRIVLSPRLTVEELSLIPGFLSFSEECAGVGMDLFKNVVKFAPAPG